MESILSYKSVSKKIIKEWIIPIAAAISIAILINKFLFFNYDGTFDVPQDEFFFLGDNRTISWDSRRWTNPYINKDSIEGKAAFRFYPFDNISSLL